MPDGHLGDAQVWGLEAGEDDGFSYFGGVHHGGVADGVFGAAFAERELGFDAAGEDGSDFDVVFAEFGIEGLGEAGLGEFGGTVDGFSGDSLQAGDGRDEENGPAFLFDHDGCGVAGEEEAGLHVGVHEGVVVFDGSVDEVFVVSCAGVVDEDVEAAEGGDGEGYGLSGGFIVGGIAGVEGGFDVGDSQGLDLVAELAEAVFAAGGDDEVGSVMGEGDGCGSADSGAGSGDESGLAG